MQQDSAWPRVLVADDDQDSAWLIQRALLETIPGIHVAVAHNGWQANNAIKAFGWACIVVDLQMGFSDGRDVMAWARRDQPEATCILMTGHANVHIAQEAVQGGVFAVLTKPLDLQKLTQTVQAALDESLAPL